MSNFPIKVGDSSGIDTYASALISGEEQLLITRDGKQYLTKGDGTKIEITDIITVSSLPSTNIKVGKIYILKDGTNYTLHYYDTSWHNIGGSLTQDQLDDIAKIDNIEIELGLKANANNVPTNAVFNNHANNYSNPHQTKLMNLVDVQANTLLDGQAITWDATNNVFKNKTIVGTTDEKVKMDSAGDSKYLGELIDDITVKNVNGKLVAKTLEGLNTTLVELNYLTGLDKNIMSYLSNNPIVLKAVVNTHADLLAIPSPVEGNMVIVKADETHSGKKWSYIYINGTWTDICESTVNVRDFLANPIDLSTETTGILQQNKIDMTDIVKTNDLINYMKSSDFTGTGTTPINVSKTLQNMTSTVTQIDNTVTNSHTHPNKPYIDKITEDVDGRPLYNGQSMGGGALTSAQEAKVNFIDITGDGTKVPFNDGTYKPLTNTDASKINGISVNDSNRSNGKLLGYNNSTNSLEYLDLTVAGIVGNAGIVNVSGSPVIIPAGNETTFVHPSVTDDKIMINVQEQIAGSTITDTHLDFSDSSKYALQDAGKILVGNNKTQLKSGVSCVANFKFSETSGAICTDSKGTYNGTYTGTTSTTDSSQGYPNTYRSFAGTTNSKVQFSSPVIPIGKKTIKFKFRKNGIPTKSEYWIDTSHTVNGFAFYGTSDGSIKIGEDNFALITINSTNAVNICNNQWHSFVYQWDGTTNSNSVKLYIDDMNTPYISSAATSPTYTNYSYNLTFGDIYNWGTNAYSGKCDLDEVEIYNDIFNLINTPTYLKTTGTSNFSLTTIDTITSLTMPVTIPTNTSIKCLVSFDNGINWLYRSSGTWHKYTGDLTIDWTSSNSAGELQTYFTNLTLTQLTSDLSSLSIVPICLDFAFQLNTQDLTVTPSISKVILVYQNEPHTELASFGSYEEQYVKFGVKRVNLTTLAVKNKTDKDRKVSVNVLTGN